MTQVPDYRGQIEGNKPQDFLHRVAAMIPGYTGYQDKERRRDADKALRMFLARRFREQHTALVSVQGQIARSRHLESIGEVDRLAGVLQRFIDKLETATQGYAGLFDPIKVQDAELDQLYTFDAALTEALQQVTDAVDAIATAARQGTGSAPAAAEGPDLPATLSRLGTVLDSLLQTWNRRNDVIASGRPMPTPDFERFKASMAPSGGAAYTAPGPAGGQPSSGPPAPQPYGAVTGAPPSQFSGGAPYVPYAGAGSAGVGQPTGPLHGSGPAGGQPYQPYAGPPGGAAPAQTHHLEPLPGGPAGPSDVAGPPTGGPADSGTHGG